MQEALRFLSPGAEPVDRAEIVEQARSLRRGSEAPSRGLSLTIRGLRKSFGDNEVLRGIDLHIPAGQSVAIVGRSGCGKSTLLRLIAGLETATAGTISLGEDARPEDVRVMFQEPRLLPWARVLSILIYALLGKLADSLARLLERLSLGWHPAFQNG